MNVSVDQISKIVNQKIAYVYSAEYAGHKFKTYEIINILESVLKECGSFASEQEKKERVVQYVPVPVRESAAIETKCQSKNERTVAKAIKQLGYTPYHNVVKKDCMGRERLLPFDFGILVNGKELLIEFDGEQHREPIEHFGGQEKFEEIKIYDQIKDEYCRKNNIPLLRLSKRSSVLREIKEFINAYS